jgi:hypothetical protein
LVLNCYHLQIELLDAEALCNEREMKALAEIVNSCLSIHESLAIEITSHLG